MPLLTQETLLKLTQDIFVAAGAPAAYAAQVAEVLVDNNLAGHDSHGILRIPEYIRSIRIGDIVPTAAPAVLQETDTSALVTGHWGLGQVVGAYATDIAIAKAKQHQVAVVSVVQANHTGRLAAFSDRAARQDIVMFMAIGTVERPMTVPYGGAAAVLGTNPVAFSIPTASGTPVTLDFATSAVAAGKVKVAKAKHQDLEPGLILDKAGNPSVNPQDFIDGGSLMPFGGHKGYALAVIAELLSGPLAGADAFPGEQRSGIFIFAMNAALFRPLEAYRAAMSNTIGRIKAVPPAPGFKEVMLPGEPEARMHAERERAGIPVVQDTWDAVSAVAVELGLRMDGYAVG